MTDQKKNDWREHLKQRLVNLPDDELVEMIETAGAYTPEALDLARAELAGRTGHVSRARESHQLDAAPEPAVVGQVSNVVSSPARGPGSLKFLSIVAAIAVGVLVVRQATAGTGGAPTPVPAAPQAVAAAASTTAVPTLDPADVPQEAQDHFANAQDMEGSGDYGLALTEVNQALAIEPHYADAAALGLRVRAAATSQVQQAIADQTAVVVQAQAEATQGAIAQATADAAAATLANDQRVASNAARAPSGAWFSSDTIEGMWVQQFSYLTSMGIYRANPGSRFVEVHIEVFNDSPRAFQLNPGNFTLVDHAGSSSSYDVATFALDDPMHAVEIAPGDHGGGWLLFLTTTGSGAARVTHRPSVLGYSGLTVNVERAPDHA